MRAAAFFAVGSLAAFVLLVSSLTTKQESSNPSLVPAAIGAKPQTVRQLLAEENRPYLSPEFQGPNSP